MNRDRPTSGPAVQLGPLLSCSAVLPVLCPPASPPPHICHSGLPASSQHSLYLRLCVRFKQLFSQDDCCRPLRHPPGTGEQAQAQMQKRKVGGRGPHICPPPPSRTFPLAQFAERQRRQPWRGFVLRSCAWCWPRRPVRQSAGPAGRGQLSQGCSKQKMMRLDDSSILRLHKRCRKAVAQEGFLPSWTALKWRPCGTTAVVFVPTPACACCLLLPALLPPCPPSPPPHPPFPFHACSCGSARPRPHYRQQPHPGQPPHPGEVALLLSGGMGRAC